MGLGDMAASLLKDFFNSSQHKQCLQALQSNPILESEGVDNETIDYCLQHAVPAAAEAMDKQTVGQRKPHLSLFNIFGGHAGWEFLTGCLVGLARGDGLVGTLEDGGMGM